MLMPWDQKEITVRSVLRKIVLRLSPGEDGSCKLETKHDSTTSPSRRGDYRNKCHKHEKAVPGLSSDEDGFL
jgi:hypothetical protein